MGGRQQTLAEQRSPKGDLQPRYLQKQLQVAPQRPHFPPQLSWQGLPASLWEDAAQPGSCQHHDLLERACHLDCKQLVCSVSEHLERRKVMSRNDLPVKEPTDARHTTTSVRQCTAEVTMHSRGDHSTEDVQDAAVPAGSSAQTLTVTLTVLVLLFMGSGHGQYPFVDSEEITHQTVCHGAFFIVTLSEKL